MRYIELCAGVGGTRAGLDAAGWECVFAADVDPDAVAVHRAAFGSIEQVDVTDLDAETLPEFDALVAGFPCQPFSSCGTRKGFLHRSGHVFEALMVLVDERRPPVLLFENVVGLLSNKSGHTFASVLAHLTDREYAVDWIVVDASWIGVPQSRPRVFMVAAQKDALTRRKPKTLQGSLFDAEVQATVFASLVERLGLDLENARHGRIRETRDRLAPAQRGGFAGFGKAMGDEFWSYRAKWSGEHLFNGELAEIVAPEFGRPDLIRSVRYWSEKGGGGKHGIHVRDLPISHCLGTNLGLAPLFAVPLDSVNDSGERKAFLRFADWHREQQDLLVMRLRPGRSVQLFGQHTNSLERAIEGWEAGTTRKFKLVGNMVAPSVAREVAEIVSDMRTRHTHVDMPASRSCQVAKPPGWPPPRRFPTRATSSTC